MNKKVTFQDLGLIDYKKCWDYQEELFAEILAVKSANRKEQKLDKDVLRPIIAIKKNMKGF